MKKSDMILKKITGAMRIMLPVMLFAAAFLLIIYYMILPAKVEFHSDCTDTLLWAQASHDSGKVFDRNFAYAALLPFSTGLVMQLFIGITGVSFTTHTIGMAAFLILFSAAFVFMLKEAGFGNTQCAAAYFVLILLISASKKLREIFWGHTIYYSLGLLFLFAGLALLFGTVRRFESGKIKIRLFLLGLLCFLSALNGVQALTIFIFPMIGAVFGYIFLDFGEKLISKKNLRLAAVGILITVCALVGFAVGKYLSRGITAGYANAYSKFVAADKWSGNINDLLRRWLTLAGVDIAGGDDLMSAKSALNIVRIFLNLLLAVLPVYRIFTYEKIKHWQTKMFLLAHWTCAALILTAWIFGKISTANWRLTPVFCTSVVFFIMFVKELAESVRYKRLGAMLMLPAVICALGSAAGIAVLDTNFAESPNGKCIALLEKNNCRYGYATFWNAQAVTVLTGEKICARNIELKDGVPKIRYYQSNKNWYKDQSGVDKYFLLLGTKEYAEVVKYNEALVDSAVGMDADDEYILLIFDGNIFRTQQKGR